MALTWVVVDALGRNSTGVVVFVYTSPLHVAWLPHSVGVSQKLDHLPGSSAL